MNRDTIIIDMKKFAVICSLSALVTSSLIALRVLTSRSVKNLSRVEPWIYRKDVEPEDDVQVDYRLHDLHRMVTTHQFRGMK